MAAGGEFQDAMRGHVDGPDVSVPVHSKAMRCGDRNFRPGLQQFAGLVKLDHRVRAAIEYPNIVVFVDGYAGALSEIPALWQLRPIQYHVMGQWRTGLDFREHG